MFVLRSGAHAGCDRHPAWFSANVIMWSYLSAWSN
jgi:hypothetical protein